jgi:hypothetical protein
MERERKAEGKGKERDKSWKGEMKGRKGGRNGKEKEINGKKQKGNPLTLNFEPILVAKSYVSKNTGWIFSGFEGE